MTQERVPILLVGAGAAGLTLSLLLLQQGIPSVLVERRTAPDWHPRARNHNFRTLEVFRMLGIEPEVIAAGARFTRTFRTTSLSDPEREEVLSADQVSPIEHLEALRPYGTAPRAGWSRSCGRKRSGEAAACAMEPNSSPSPRMQKG